MNKISIIIVNYNGQLFIEECLLSILASHCEVPIETIVIDNHSTDESLSVLKKYRNNIKLIKNNHNSGFAKANNIAVSYATGNLLFLLNNDTILQKNTIQTLYDYIKKNHDCAVVVPKLLNKDGSIQCPGSIFGQWRFKSKKTRVLPFVAGAAIMIEKNIYEDIGGFDEHMFFYNEDVDLCKTLHKKKVKLYYEPLAALTHIGGVSTSFRKSEMLVEGYRGGFYLCQKHYSSIVLVLYRMLILLDLIPRLCVSGILSRINSKYISIYKAYKKVIKINKTKDFMYKHPPINVSLES